MVFNENSTGKRWKKTAEHKLEMGSVGINSAKMEDRIRRDKRTIQFTASMGYLSRVTHDVLGGGVSKSNWQQNREVCGSRVGLENQSGLALCESFGGT